MPGTDKKWIKIEIFSGSSQLIVILWPWNLRMGFFLMPHFYSVPEVRVLCASCRRELIPGGGFGTCPDQPLLVLVVPLGFGLLWIGAFCSLCPVPAWKEGLDMES